MNAYGDDICVRYKTKFQIAQEKFGKRMGKEMKGNADSIEKRLDPSIAPSYTWS